MSLDVLSVPSSEKVPARADVVVIGGGIIGIATAYGLIKKGLSVVVVEKGRVAAEQSSRNWGWCRKQNRDERELPLIKASLDQWEQIQLDTGRDMGFRRTGITYVSDRPADMAAWESWNQMARGYDVDSRMLSSVEAKAMALPAEGQWLGGCTSSSDGRAEPGIAVPTLALLAQEQGLIILQNCAARGLERSAGRVSGVVTERGSIQTNAVVCAAGAWSAMFARHHGLALPQAGVYSTSMRTEVAPEVISGGLSLPGLTIRRRLDGGYTLGLAGRGRVELSPQGMKYARAFWPTYKARKEGVKIRAGKSFFRGPEAFRQWSAQQVSPFEEVRVLNPAPDLSLVREAEETLARYVPALAGVRVIESWGGFIDNTPDAIPVIDEIQSCPGFYLSTGYSGHGFGIGLAAGQLTADLVAGDRPIVDATAFRYSRFFDGSDLGKPGMM
ncbi:FAD-binding oxidoreductase [Paenalcaligenes niemegkensis]|uniref:NAD(P)/FAD-dependent oxidoreductase n=1 Tax=Paenalcaligenes niemegkensis TaxID=2895469 RepID=UPI001EE9A7AF|nr:FAD-binding oxidoreductase [Paenalcaligenes niemegkensis]MCQ9615603.1 FAD-binding oxidoreductase [Paenalcaligenes niemegkensis]